MCINIVYKNSIFAILGGYIFTFYLLKGFVMSVEQSYVEINSVNQIEQVRNQLATKMSVWQEKFEELKRIKPEAVWREQPYNEYLEIRDKICMAENFWVMFDFADTGGVVYLVMEDVVRLNNLLTGD